MGFDIRASFEFVADNPITICLAGGVLFLVIWILLGVSLPSNPYSGYSLAISIVLFVFGFILYLADRLS